MEAVTKNAPALTSDPTTRVLIAALHGKQLLRPRDTAWAMSQENVELTLQALDAWNRRDVEANVALSDPEIVWYPVIEGLAPGGRAYRGRAGMRQYFKDLAETSEWGHLEFPEVHDLGDQVLALGHLWFRFASGVELDREIAFLLTWRNGKCVEGRSWLSRADALEAAGLRE